MIKEPILMNALLLKEFIVFILLVLPVGIAKPQTEKSIPLFEPKELEKYVSDSTNINQELNLISSNKEIEHVFHITMSKKDFKKLKRTENIEKDYLSDCIITYNNDSLNVKEINLRGRSSMNFKRKSFSVKLNKKIAINKDGTVYKFKKFNLISLSMDCNYYRNKIAFDLMGHLKLFNLFYTFTEVIINGQTQGIYLMVQKPKNYAFKDEDANFMLRRDYENKIKKTYCLGDDIAIQSKYEEAFKFIYNELIEKDAQEFYEELKEILDVEQYFTWMAFNFLIGNRDYTDEVFFFNNANGDSVQFGIIPWDYDDIFFEYPHEGYLIHYLNYGNKLAFSSEDALDYKLIVNDYTYNKYLQTLSDVVEEISIDTLKEIYELTYQELYPYYCKEEVMKVGKADKYGKTSLANLEQDMQKTFKWLIQRREETIITLESSIVENAKNSKYQEKR